MVVVPIAMSSCYAHWIIQSIAQDVPSTQEDTATAEGGHLTDYPALTSEEFF